jgi:hypothetical protein
MSLDATGFEFCQKPVVIKYDHIASLLITDDQTVFLLDEAHTQTEASIQAESDARALPIDAGTPVPSTTPAASSPQSPAEPNLNLPVLRNAPAVLNGQPDMLESVAACFDGTDAKIRKDEEGLDPGIVRIRILHGG